MKNYFNLNPDESDSRGLMIVYFEDILQIDEIKIKKSNNEIIYKINVKVKGGERYYAHTDNELIEKQYNALISAYEQFKNTQ